MYGWIVDGIYSLFEPITGQTPTEWPRNVAGDIPALAQGQRQDYHPRPGKRNYQSVYVAEHVNQNEQLEVKRRRRDVVISFVKKTVAGVAGLLRLRSSLQSNCKIQRSCRNQPVTLMGIDELQTSWMNSSDWMMDKPSASGLSEKEGLHPFQSSSPPLLRKYNGSSLPSGKPEWGKDREKKGRCSLQLLPSKPSVGLETSSPNPDCHGPAPNRSFKPCLTVEEAIKRSDKEHYRRLVEMVSEKYSRSQPLPFTQTKPQEASLPPDATRTVALGRTIESTPRTTFPYRATPNVFMWRDSSSTNQVKDRRGEVCHVKTHIEAAVDTQHVRNLMQRKAAEVDLSTEVATRLNLVEKGGPAHAQTETYTTHTRHSEEDLPKLTKEMAVEVNRALVQRDPNLIVSSAFKLRIAQRDLATLQEGSWLNDEVINFYLSMVMERGFGPGGGLRVYSFSTFFFPKLRGRAGGQAGGHAAVKRWTKAVDLFQYDVILVPLHLGVHWSLASIDFKSKSVRSYDSMGQRHEDICNLLLVYLKEEHKAKKGRDLDSSKWTVGSMRAIEIPQQKNGSDCGVFTCKYADYISQGRPLTFRQCHMPLFRKLMIWEILNQKLL
ncbi:sentrin-specific protease 2 [Aplochiton taeniatus]